MEDKKENNYPKELKLRMSHGHTITPVEEAKFENEFGRYKSRSETTILDLVNAINQGKLNIFASCLMLI